jgi:ATPase family associated with various cellular activities (AAA)
MSSTKRPLESPDDSSVKPPKQPRKFQPTIPPPRNTKRKEQHEVVFEKNGRKLLLDLSQSDEHRCHYLFEIKALEDLLFLAEYYPKLDKTKVPNLPFFQIRRIEPALQKLLAMVGLNGVKEQLFQMIVYHLQRFERKNHDMLHSVIYGGPGVGKTKFIAILGEIYAKLGILEHGRVRFVKRSDLVGKYLGHTAAKTRQVIEDARGGVLVIDEAYSLGDTEGRDSFSRECIDTLNQALSEEKQNFVCIIAGYKEDLEQRFFNSNPGLERRFPFRYSIPDYTPSQLREIFLSIVAENQWEMDPKDLPLDPFEDNKDYFTFNGGDMEVIFTKAKFAHSVRVFSHDRQHKKKLTKVDFETGLQSFLSMDNVKRRRQVNEMISWMYL